MRGQDARQTRIFSFISAEERVPTDHPLRPIRKMVDEALLALSPRFQTICSPTGRPGIPPERLLRTLLLRRTTRLVTNSLRRDGGAGGLVPPQLRGTLYPSPLRGDHGG